MASKTGQLWKGALFTPVIYVTGVLGVLASSGIYRHPVLDIVNAVVFLAGLLLSFRSIRCPFCGAAVGWTLLTRSRAGELWRKLIDLEVCPVCRDDRSAPRSPRLFSVWRRP